MDGYPTADSEGSLFVMLRLEEPRVLQRPVCCITMQSASLVVTSTVPSRLERPTAHERQLRAPEDGIGFELGHLDGLYMRICRRQASSVEC